MSSINPSFKKSGKSVSEAPTDPVRIASQILKGDKASLSRAITFAESRKKEHQEIANKILEACVANRKPEKSHSLPSRRIGITGYPGAGKSTLLEALGLLLVHKGASVAVLTVDPTGLRTDGSILGDKTRMNELSKHPSAFIRPSPSSKSLGGVTTSTYTSIQLCEAAGYEWVFVETVGVGQSEAMVSLMSDIVCLLLIPGAGDDLQGMKRGLMDMVNVLVINKSDGPNIEQAKQTAQHYQQALGWEALNKSSVTHPHSVIHRVSATSGEGLSDLLDWLAQWWDSGLQSGAIHRKRDVTIDRLMTIEASLLLKQWMDSVIDVNSPDWKQAKRRLLEGDQLLPTALKPVVESLLSKPRKS
jgi:LAO/AO transport system kinase